MTLQQLRYVTAIAEAGTLSEAARRFYIAQPSLTASLRELEEELGLTIFRRTNRGAVLTPEGEEFLGYARQVLAQMDLMEEKYLGAAPVKHQFCVSTQHYSFAVEAFVELLREYPGTKELPPEVAQRVAAGETPLAAMRAFELAQMRAQLAAKDAAQKNRQTAPGSAGGLGGKERKDDFEAGFDAGFDF